MGAFHARCGVDGVEGGASTPRKETDRPGGRSLQCNEMTEINNCRFEYKEVFYENE